MPALAVALLGVAAVWPPARALRVTLGAVAGAALVWSVWDATFHGPFTDGEASNAWVLPAMVLLAGVAAAVLPSLPSPAGVWLGWRWLLLVGSATAVYGCVPETDQMPEVAMLLLAGAAIEQLRRRPLPAPALLAAWGVLAWSALYGATGRPSALLGGLFALLPPLTAAVVGGRDARCSAFVGALWVGAAVAVARTGGISPRSAPAVLAVAIGALVAGSLSALLWRRWPTPPPDA